MPLFINLMLAMLCLLCAAATSTCSHTKAFTTADGAKYVYDYIPAKGNNATFALIHGYPATRHDWKHQIQLLSSAGYGIIAPDCLGYGDSDMPLDVSEYRLKRLAAHSDELFEHEHLSKVIGVGHDWGTILLSQTAAWHSNRFEKLVFISVGFSAPGFFFDIDALNFQSLESFGFTQLGYWYFLNSYNAADLVAERLESFYSLAFPVDNSKWGENLANIGAARQWLSKKVTTDRPKWLSGEDKRKWMDAFSKTGAATASMSYYKTLLRGISASHEENFTDEQRTLKVPVLTVGGSQDVITTAEQMIAQTAPWAASGYVHREVDAGHWIIHEKPHDVNRILLDFAKD